MTLIRFGGGRQILLKAAFLYYAHSGTVFGDVPATSTVKRVGGAQLYSRGTEAHGGRGYTSAAPLLGRPETQGGALRADRPRCTPRLSEHPVAIQTFSVSICVSTSA